MDDKRKVILIAVAAAVLVAAAGYAAYDYFGRGGANEVYTSPEWKGLTPEEREKKLDDEERKRRAMGRGPSRRRLPEDPPAGPPKKIKPTKTGPRMPATPEKRKKAD